jgi:uncharacterized SAM-binding protein YcdF (DUF218 family)
VLIVVPDGLAAEGRPVRAVARPNFAFRAVLDHVAAHHATRRVLVAPANDFGCGAYEQEVAQAYLLTRGASRVDAPPSPRGGYIDTRGNAATLRAHLEKSGQWPLGPAILAVTRPHARRARLCFRKEGYDVRRVEAVPFVVPVEESTVARLWFYRHPRLHALYESVALLRDLARPAARP